MTDQFLQISYHFEALIFKSFQMKQHLACVIATLKVSFDMTGHNLPIYLEKKHLVMAYDMIAQFSPTFDVLI